MSQSDFAEAMGVDSLVVAEWESLPNIQIPVSAIVTIGLLFSVQPLLIMTTDLGSGKRISSEYHKAFDSKISTLIQKIVEVIHGQKTISKKLDTVLNNAITPDSFEEMGFKVERKPRFSSNLFNLRKKTGMTQQELADATGLKRVTVANYEGKRGTLPRHDHLDKLCKYFDITPQALLYEDVTKYPASTKGLSPLVDMLKDANILSRDYQILTLEAKNLVDLLFLMSHP